MRIAIATMAGLCPLTLGAAACAKPRAGTFVPAPGSPFPVGKGPAHVAAGDFNGDGRVDIAVVNLGSNDAPSAVGKGNWFVVTADVDGDGKADVVVPSRDENTLIVLLAR